jgi:hypothetical protein
MKMNQKQKEALVKFLDESAQTKQTLVDLLTQFDASTVHDITARMVGKMEELGLTELHPKFLLRRNQLLDDLRYAGMGASTGVEYAKKCAKIANSASYYYLTHDPERDILEEIWRHYEEDRGSIRLKYSGQNFFDVMGVS